MSGKQMGLMGKRWESGMELPENVELRAQVYGGRGENSQAWETRENVSALRLPAANHPN